MKKKALAVTITFAFCAAAMSAATVQPVLAQDMESRTETADFSKIAGFWKNADSKEEETLAITEDGLFSHRRKEAEDTQGYLEYVDEYGDGNGDYIPEEESYYEEDGNGNSVSDEENYDEDDGRGDYIPGDYVENSDPGDTYYWYDGEGNVMFFDGYDHVYIGPSDVFYIDDAGRLCEF